MELSKEKTKYRPVKGKTYSLFGQCDGTEEYYALIKRLAGRFLKERPGEMRLLTAVQKASDRSTLKKLFRKDKESEFAQYIIKALAESLSAYTENVGGHLKTLPLTKRFDPIIAASELQYHLYMLEIELVNRLYKEQFKRSGYKFALIAHCLRDFRPSCAAEPGDVEAVCKGCNKECFINLSSALLKDYGIVPYISVETEQKRLFKKILKEHKSVGALGVACIPELARGMRLCISLGIHPVGIPLDANRCARWMENARENFFNLDELQELLR